MGRIMKSFNFSTLDLVSCISGTIDLVDNRVSNHNKQVAYIAYSIAREMGYSSKDLEDIFIAGALHDSGALSLNERLSALSFDEEFPHRHEEAGYQLLKQYKPFSRAAELIRFHHRDWEYGDGAYCSEGTVPEGSFILHLADRIAVLVDPNGDIFSQVDMILERICSQKGARFHPEALEAFIELSQKEYFWLDIVSQSRMLQGESNYIKFESQWITAEELLSIARLFSTLIDFRSPFTATHSVGVSISSSELARLAGFNEEDCLIMKIAGFFHDLGKLAVPTEILNKPSKLTPEEFRIVKAHTYYTYQILDRIPDFDEIKQWSSYHHESLNGTGYPFHKKGDELSLGSRIMAVADVFTALMEDRPYRKGMSKKETIGIMNDMRRTGKLDGDVVELLVKNFDDLEGLRRKYQEGAGAQYLDFTISLERREVTA